MASGESVLDAAGACGSQHNADMFQLTLERIQQIQLECMADDVKLDYSAMSRWPESAIRTYFESGGATFPQPGESFSEDQPAPAPAAVTTATSSPLAAEAGELLRAAEAGDEALVRDLLLHKRPPVDVIDVHGRFPLMLAAQNGHDGTVKALLQNRARPSQSTSFTLHRTALMAATLAGHEEVVRTLLMHGASAEQADGNGDTAIALATEAKHMSTLQTLRELRGMCL